MAKRKRSGSFKRGRKRVRRRRSTIRIGSHRTTGTVMRVGKNVGSADRTTVKLVYCDTSEFNTALDSTSTFVWRGSSIEDPQFTVGGHQPRFHDQWNAMYVRYQVNACKVVCRILQIGTNHDAARCYLIASDSSAAPTAIDYCEHNGVRKAVIGQGKPSAMLSLYRTTRSVLGPKRAGQAASGANFGLNPVDEWFFKFGIHNDNVAGTLTVDVEFTLTYYCVLSERRQPNIS